MCKKVLVMMMVIFILVTIFCFGHIYAQGNYRTQQRFSNEELKRIDDKLNELVSLCESYDTKKMQDKLDIIIQNQAQIIDELKIIKVRASQ